MTPTHAEIRDDLRRRITEGEYTAGQPLADVDTLSLEYGAELSTVRRALHELATEGLIKLTLQAVVS